jgi:hypothetical protein
MAIFTAIGVGLFGAGTLMAGISAAALQVAAGLALNYFAASLNGQPDQQTAGMQGQLQVGAEVSRTVNIGLGLSEHSLVYANYWGDDGKTPNAYLTQVFCLGDYPVKSLAEFYIDGVKVAFSGAQTADGLGRSVDQYRRDGKDHAWVKFYDGTQTAADAFLVSKFGGHPERPYQAGRVGYGCPYIVVTTLVNDELWNGWPAIKAVLSGARLYDVSRDSTRGGNGSHRVDQPGTWGGDGDDLTAVQAYALLRGFRFEGQWLYGLQNLPLAQLPDAWWISQINACRATVLGPNGQEPTYRSGGSLAVSRPISDAITDLVTSCQGHIVEVGGEYRLHVGGAKTPVFHITDGDVFSTEERRFTPFFGLSETVNGISATHPSPENGWNVLPLPTLLRSDLETIDGNRRLTAAVALDLVPYEWQAQRIMQSALEEARRERQLTLALPGSFYFALPGEWITFTSVANGFDNKLFRIDGSADRDDGHVLWDLTEIDPADYDPDFSTYTPPVDGSLQPGYVPAQFIVGWSVTPDSIKDDQGRPRRPAVRFSWDPDIEDVRAVGFQLRTASGLDLVLDESFDNVRLGSIALASARILANQDLEGRGRYYSASGKVPQDWTGWLPVRTPDIGLSLADIDAEFGAVVGIITGMGEGSLSERLQEFYDKLAKLAATEVSATVQAYTERRELEAEIGENRAYFLEQVTVLVDADQAMATRVTALTTSFNQNVAFVGQQLTALSTANSALASSIDQVEVALDGITAGATFQMVSSAGPSGWSTKIAAVVRANVGSNFYEAGWYTLVNSNGDNVFAVKANDFYFLNESGGVITSPFYITDGTVYIKTAVIQDLTIGNNKITDNAISDDFSAVDDGQFEVYNSNTVILSCAVYVPTAASKVYVFAGTSMGRMGSSDATRTYVLLRRDGIGLQEKNTRFAVSGAGDTQSHIPFYRPDYPGVGWHTYDLLVHGDDSRHFNRSIIALVMKK